MDKIYKTHERFLNASKKFPRWANVRRRPTHSTEGKLLESIVEEIGFVEDAIIDYKKDFFEVNYIGKESKIIDYLYTAYIGELPTKDVENIRIDYPEKITGITLDLKRFYKDKNLAYYDKGYLITRAISDKIEYSYNGFRYSVKSEKTHIWNIYDEFAWWAGLKRLENEENKELLRRTFNQFRNRPNSTEKGLKNAIMNVIGDDIREEDIVIEKPDEKNMSIELDGQTVYEIISKFNRDIARTKKWDIDYWENSFATTKCLPHIWDAEVENYKDGIGYNDSLDIDHVDDLDLVDMTDVEIIGWKMNSHRIDEYFKNNEIIKNIELKLNRFGDEINTIPVTYKVNASTLERIKEPENIFIDAYDISNSKKKYFISDFVIDNKNIDIVGSNKLEPGKKYTIKVTPIEDPLSTMEIEKCELREQDGKNGKNILVQKGKFGYDERGLFKNKSVVFHADNVNKFTNVVNISDNKYGGMMLDNGHHSGYLEINAEDMTKNGALPITIRTRCDPYSISGQPNTVKCEYVSMVDGKYVFEGDEVRQGVLTLTFDSVKQIFFDIGKKDSGIQSPLVTIEVYINDELDEENSYFNVPISTFKDGYTLSNTTLEKTKVIIRQEKRVPFVVENIRIAKFDFALYVNDEFVSLNKKGYGIIPQTDECHIKIVLENYGRHDPVIDCVHIGGLMYAITSTYKFNFDTNGMKKPILDIKTNCNVEVIDYETKNTINYKTHPYYVNNTQDIQGLFLDLTRFKSIVYSSKDIRRISNDETGYIELMPGESIRTIEITGRSEKLLSRKNLLEALDIKSDEDLYSNKEIEAFVVKSPRGERLTVLTEIGCSYKEADLYKVWGSGISNLKACFVGDKTKNVRNYGNVFGGKFEYMYMFSENSRVYTNYNSQNIIKPVTEGFKITRSFSPAIPENASVLYIIQNVISDKDGYEFEVTFDNGRKWTSDINKDITIKTDIDILKKQVLKEEKITLNHIFSLANEIPLNEYYTINDKNYVLAKYVITPPENMHIEYEKHRIEEPENMAIEEDGFNKLSYSNISNIVVKANDVIIPESEYELLSEGGIIRWKNDKYVGQALDAFYDCAVPKSIRFNSLEDMYEISGYSEDTLEKIETNPKYIVKNQKDSDLFQIDYSYFDDERPDKFTLKFSNPCFSATINEDIVSIKKSMRNENLLIRNGVYYIDGKEYWYFANRFEEDKESHDGIKYNNVDKLGKNLYMSSEAINYLENSKMICNFLAPHCMVDFTYEKTIPNISSLNHIGACDSYAKWLTYEMDVELRHENNNNVIVFKPRRKTAHAILDITDALKTCKIVSMKVSGDIDAYIGGDIIVNSSYIRNDLMIEKIDRFKRSGEQLYYDCSHFEKDTRRYYIIVEGPGIIDEILVTNAKNEKEISDNHISVFKKFGFDFEEENEKNRDIYLDFSGIGNSLNRVELSRDEDLRLSTSIHWGITPIESFELNQLNTIGFSYRKNTLISEKEGAAVYIEKFEKPSISIKKLYLKINDFAHDELENFQINVYARKQSRYDIVSTFTNTNFIMIPTSDIENGYRIEILAGEGKVIKSISMLAEYAEDENGQDIRGYYKYTDGECITKVYDIGQEETCIFKDIVKEYETAPDGIKYYIRGLKTGENVNVWTKWYTLSDKHIFDNYRFFQFKIRIENEESKVKINNFVIGGISE